MYRHWLASGRWDCQRWSLFVPVALHQHADARCDPAPPPPRRRSGRPSNVGDRASLSTIQCQQQRGHVVDLLCARWREPQSARRRAARNRVPTKRANVGSSTSHGTRRQSAMSVSRAEPNIWVYRLIRSSPHSPRDVELAAGPLAMLRSRISGEFRASFGRWRFSRILSGVSVAGMPKPSPRSTALTASISRSGTSLRNSATTNPTRATGAAQRNTSAERIGVGGDDRRGHVVRQLVQRLRGLRGRGGAPLAASAGPIRSCRKLVNSEPKMAAPNELPMVRKNVTPDVATPRSAKLEVFCTIRTSTCMHIPMPAPRTNRYSDCSHDRSAGIHPRQQQERRSP